ncbi:hypothetical protein BKA70DRAFT_679425 [Coprinopsis sp. MPI-PUGE-AT-0042]|nr:hypothetical protein BKA70DRAFT_679425 [Coprinopsis sp. MPI-PUGE-AT-0042]
METWRLYLDPWHIPLSRLAFAFLSLSLSGFLLFITGQCPFVPFWLFLILINTCSLMIDFFLNSLCRTCCRCLNTIHDTRTSSRPFSDSAQLAMNRCTHTLHTIAPRKHT